MKRIVILLFSMALMFMLFMASPVTSQVNTIDGEVYTGFNYSLDTMQKQGVFSLREARIGVSNYQLIDMFYATASVKYIDKKLDIYQGLIGINQKIDNVDLFLEMGLLENYWWGFTKESNNDYYYINTPLSNYKFAGTLPGLGGQVVSDKVSVMLQLNKGNSDTLSYLVGATIRPLDNLALGIYYSGTSADSIESAYNYGFNGSYSCVLNKLRLLGSFEYSQNYWSGDITQTDSELLLGLVPLKFPIGLVLIYDNYDFENSGYWQSIFGGLTYNSDEYSVALGYQNIKIPGYVNDLIRLDAGVSF